jgi:hypothetical protein
LELNKAFYLKPVAAVWTNFLGLRDGESTVRAGGWLFIAKRRAASDARAFSNRIGSQAVFTSNSS